MTVNNQAKLILQNSATGKILLLKRSQSDERRPGQWDLPGGRVEDGELLEEAAARECLEEAGVAVNKNQLKLVYSIRNYFDDERTLLVNWLIFSASTASELITLSHEHEESKWVEYDEAIELIEYPRYKEALTQLKPYFLS